MHSSQGVELEFERGQADADAIQGVIDELRAEGGEAEKQLAGLRIEVREVGQGSSAVLTGIAVAVMGGIAKDAAVALWETTLWPRIRRRLGAKAVGERRDT